MKPNTVKVTNSIFSIIGVLCLLFTAMDFVLFLIINLWGFGRYVFNNQIPLTVVKASYATFGMFLFMIIVTIVWFFLYTWFDKNYPEEEYNNVTFK